MKILFVFDSSLVAAKVSQSLFKQGDTVCLFPLTSQSVITALLEEKIKKVGCETKKIQTAAMLNSAAENLRDKYIKFIAGLSREVQYKRKNLRELFAVDKYATLWWFSLVSEKSTLKSDAFNSLAQLESIVGFINDSGIKKVILWCRNKKLQNALYGYTSQHSIRFDALPGRLLDGLRRRVSVFQWAAYIKHVLSLLNFAVNFYRRTWRIKKTLYRLRRGLYFYNKELAVITPYPNMNIELAQKGIFKNKYYPLLQEALENDGQRIAWIAMNIDNNSIPFPESLIYAKRFIRNGYTIFFLEEFNSISAQLKALLIMVKNGLKFLRIGTSIAKAHTFGSYNFYPLLRDDWYASFAGTAGYAGLLYYSIFKFMFDRFKIKSCLYFYEMQTWEKALICARKAKGRDAVLYGYQAGTIPRMLLNFFNDSSEINDDTLYALPRPDRIICSGPLHYRYMRESGWPEKNLLVAEAIRYNYLKEHLRKKWYKKKDVVLLALSISPEESSSILSIACESFRDMNGMEVWVKPHPFLDLERAFKLSGISEENSFFMIKRGQIEEFLPEARIIIAGESGVAIEALAFGCEIVIVNAPEWINMSLLRYVKTNTVKIAASPEELRQIVLDKLNEEYRSGIYEEEYRRIINDFFCLNQDSDTPYRFLKLLNTREKKKGTLYNEKMV